ncbi:MAG: hypothetical protein GC182_11165 [Rhodopseudomonas sp.]|nr:hypothetical protein [Rhodopseudomonas sp.]
MKKIVLSVVAALAVTAAAPAFAADMPVKAYTKAPAPAPSPWDIAFGTAFTSDYILRGISQSNKQPAVQGYFELDYTAAPWLTLYAGVWGSSLYSGFANAEFDNSVGARLSYEKFGLDLGYVYYAYPGPAATSPVKASSSISYGEFYAKPSYKVTDWLTLSGSVYTGDNFGNSGVSATYYSGGAAVTLPQFMPWGITSTISGEIGRQTYGSGLKAAGVNFADYTQYNIGIAFNYKAMTLDLRYYDTNASSTAAQCTSTPSVGAGSNICKDAFVATLKFDTTFSALK